MPSAVSGVAACRLLGFSVVTLYRVRQIYGNQGLMERYKFNSLSAINLTRVKSVH